MITEVLKNSILIEAFKGNLTERNKDDSSVDELLKTIEEEKQAIIIEKKIDKISQTISDKEIPFCIPQNWRWVRWGNLSYSIQYGVNAGAKNQGKIKMVRISDIQDNSIIWENVPYCDISDNLLSKYVLNENDILFARTGGTVGKSVIVSDMPKDVPYVFAGYLIRSNYNERINCKFLKFFMESPLYWKQLRDETIGSAQPNCNGQKLSNMILPFPPIEEQQRIVDKIEELFAKLDEIKPIEDELEMIKSTFSDQMKKSILNDCFSGTANFINENYKIWKSDLIINIADICTGNSIPESVKKSKYATAEIGYNYIATKDLLFNHTFNYNNGIKIPYSEKRFKYASKNDILMCIEGGSAGKKIGILDEKVCYGNKLCKFSIKTDTVIPKFLYYYLQSNVFLKNFYENLNGIIGGVSVNKIKKIKIKYPSVKEQQRIVDKLELLLPLCDEIENLVKENYNG